MKGKFATQLNTLEGYLSNLHLLKQRNLYQGPEFQMSSIRDLSYDEVWMAHFKKNWYHFLLEDNSLLFFKTEQPESFSYLGCPYVCFSYREFVAENGLDYTEIRDSLSEDYENYLMQSELKQFPDYFRYDFDPGSYRPGLHPASHIHCGLTESVRIGILYEMDIMAFVGFILRQIYPGVWQTVLKNKGDYPELFGFKQGLTLINKQFYATNDQQQDWYLT